MFVRTYKKLLKTLPKSDFRLLLTLTYIPGLSSKIRKKKPAKLSDKYGGDTWYGRGILFQVYQGTCNVF